MFSMFFSKMAPPLPVEIWCVTSIHLTYMYLEGIYVLILRDGNFTGILTNKKEHFFNFGWRLLRNLNFGFLPKSFRCLVNRRYLLC
jgi:hypothetical protein